MKSKKTNMFTFARTVMAFLIVFSGGISLATAGSRKTDVAETVPLNLIPAQHRESVSDVIRNASFHKKSQAETFPANPRVYLRLLNEPMVTLSLWHDLGDTPAKLEQIGPGQFRGTDGSGTSAVWEYLVRTPKLHVMICDLEYVSPRGAARLNGRIVLIVRSGYFQEVNGDPWVQQQVELFVKVDSRGWKAVAATLRPVIEKILDEQVQEAGWFISLMTRIVEMYPDWATSVVERQPSIPGETRTAFVDVVKQTRREGASTGRPVMKDAQAQQASLSGPPRR